MSADISINKDYNIHDPVEPESHQESSPRDLEVPTEQTRSDSGVGSELNETQEFIYLNNDDNYHTDDDEIHDKHKDEETGLVGKAGDTEKGSRAAWGGKLEFLFTIIGSAVGLGNIWRFPYLCYKNGGGAFLLPYLIMLFIVGFPLFFMELAFAQFASLGPITIWKINPLFKGLGYAMVTVGSLISIYYNVIISHVLLYLFASLAGIRTGLPWISCDNWWNTDRCIVPAYTTEESSNSSTLNDTDVNNMTLTVTTTLGTNISSVLNQTAFKTPAEEYYNNFVLEMTNGIDEGGGLNWKLTLCLLLAWILAWICLIRGISSLGKVAYFTALFPYVMLTILLVRGLTLPGAGQGILYYIKPDFSRLKDPRVWSDAATQIFYSLSACTGQLLTMASYNKFHNNCYRDSMIVGIVDGATSFYSGLVIFSILGFMAAEKGVSVADVATGGPGLAFVVYPEAISRMPLPILWAIFFFIMMATLGFGSEFAIVESVLGAFTDEYSNKLSDRGNAVIFRTGAIIFAFFMGLPMVSRGGIYVLEIVDYSVSGFPLLFVGLLECCALSWIYGYENFADDILMMIGKKPNICWRICWQFVTPIIIALLIIFNIIFFKEPSYGEFYSYPQWAVVMSWLISLFPIFLIVFFFSYRFCNDGGYQLMKGLMQPKERWGPYLSEDRKDTVYELNKQTDDEFDDDMWDYDFRGVLHQPHTIVLAKTPAPSMISISNIPSTAIHGPVLISPRLAELKGTPQMRRAAARRNRRMSKSFSNLTFLNNRHHHHHNHHGSTRSIPHSLGFFHKNHGNSDRHSVTDVNKPQYTKPSRSISHEHIH